VTPRTAGSTKPAANGSNADSLLPTAKTPASLDAKSAKVLLYGHPKVGKSTLAAGIDPDHTLFIATEPGLGGLEVFQARCGSWATFRSIGAQLAEGEHEFHTVVIDTIDELAKMCTDYVMGKLGISHPSDAAYGKGWAAVSDEFRLRVAKISSLGLGVWFVSHAQDREIQTRVGSLTRTVPTLTGKMYEFISGFVDYILLAEVHTTEAGLVRQLRTMPTENYEAGGRFPLPDPLELDPAVVRKAMEEAS